MARMARIVVPNIPHHVTQRGNRSQKVFFSHKDKSCYIKLLHEHAQKAELTFWAYCLMDNHVHLVIETTNKITISKVMQAITLSYSVKFRKKYGYSGYVWQGRFRSNVIDGDYYISACLEYIHNNPIRAKMVKRLEDYLWSSFHFYDNGNNHLNKFIEIDKFKS